MALTIGCVGCGNMGGAIMAGLARKGGYNLCGYNRTAARMRPLEELGVRPLESPLAVAQAADVLVLGVKPYQAADVLGQMRPGLTADKTLVSVAAGVSRQKLTQAVESRCPVVRCMPNTPALVGKGVFALCFEDPALPDARKGDVLALFNALGVCVELPESKFTAFSALIGAGPAYVFAMMQGLVQAGVTLGFQHRESREMVTALFAGCAKMVEQSSAPLMQLRDDVCSPGGLTIAGVNVLDREGLVGLLVDSVLAANTRGKEMES
ncbi:pyrroline-5-carboxylate reductase [Desulfovibrio desulfuricans]|uniref:Pyrroline-5-carboxylate reductase n=1 Tax=Desulfovibrio desulfuricans TaxID=876 RepID=A0A4P7UK90_DESDE|nr:pyrroline-5-carboxylate reductase [Desulfovibrio desulfuricans]QCC85001.1 pyrroline-5-carboxylate reductase [Desulfovibrio desulfuricans]